MSAPHSDQHEQLDERLVVAVESLALEAARLSRALVNDRLGAAIARRLTRGNERNRLPAVFVELALWMFAVSTAVVLTSALGHPDSVASLGRLLGMAFRVGLLGDFGE
jgi:hypothetical protein